MAGLPDIWRAAMRRFHVTVGVLQCPMNDDDLDQLDQDSAGWQITGRSGGWRSGFRLDLRGPAEDPGSAERTARTEVVRWLGTHGLSGDVAIARVRRELP